MTRQSPTFDGTLACERCGNETPRCNAMQRYCPECSVIADVERKNEWRRKNGRKPLPEHTKAVRGRRQARLRAVGEERSVASSIFGPGVPELAWECRISVPFDTAFSKNHIYTGKPQGHVALREETRTARAGVTWELKAALRRGGHVIRENRLWIWIHVQKPNHRGDAINVLDVVCDAIKDAVPIDDRWFSVRQLDWEIVKRKPRIFIGVGQEDVVDVRPCSYCGQLRPLDDFLGTRRECIGCREGARVGRSR